MKKTLLSVLAVIIIMTLTSCSSSNSSSNFEFDKDSAIFRAKEAVEVVNTRDYEEIVKLFREDLREQVKADEIKSALDSQLKKAGDFTKYESETAVAQKQSGTEYIIVVLVCKYENSTLIFTISLDTDMNIVGLYMK